MSLDDPLLRRQADALFAGERDPIANAANLAALIMREVPELNWAGFYFRQGAELVLGPFQGAPACVRIPWGKGVCGTAAATGRLQRVHDVHAFEGHIACDPQSNAELVAPLLRAGEVEGVLDLDSPRRGRFSEDDARGLEALAAAWVSASAPLPR